MVIKIYFFTGSYSTTFLGVIVLNEANPDFGSLNRFFSFCFGMNNNVSCFEYFLIVYQLNYLKKM